MFLGACQLMNFAWIQFGPNMEIFVSPKLMKLEQGLTCLQAFTWATDLWMRSAMVSQAPVCLAKYPQETANILHCDIFCFFLKDEEFMSKTINDSSIDLDKFQASKVRQFAKEMEASKATVHHIKQVVSDPQASQINLMQD